MSRVHEEAAEILDDLLRRAPEGGTPSLEEIDQALERLEDLSKRAQSEEDDEYLASVGESLLDMRATIASRD